LGVAVAGDEAGLFEYFEMFGDGREAQFVGFGHERLGQFGDRGFARGEAGEDGATGGVG
jgi:hypothetical protein